VFEMAVTTSPVSSDLVLLMDNGIGASGQPLSRARRYSNIKTTATNEDLYAVADSLTGLQSQTRLAVRRQDTIEIEQV
jgi:hypothetical protein